MKIAIINFSGNTGKTTLARYLLLVRLFGAQQICVESINDGAGSESKIKGKQFDQLIQAMAIVDSMVVDVGSSNVEAFLSEMRRYQGSQDDFDYYVIPTTPALKQQRDTIATIEALADLQVPASKIRLCFNNVDIDADISQVFSGLFDYHRQLKKFTLQPEALVHSTDLFSKLGAEKLTIQELLADETDYKTLIQAAETSKEKLHFSSRLALRRLCIGVNQQLDVTFKALFS